MLFETNKDKVRAGLSMGIAYFGANISFDMNNYHFCWSKIDSYNRNSYYANYELFSNFEPDKHDRLAMRFPTDDD